MGWDGEKIRARNDKRKASAQLRRIGRAVGIAGTVVILVAALILVAAFSLRYVEPKNAGPFGLAMGMQPSEFGGMLVKERYPGWYRMTQVPRPHSSFVVYRMMFGPKTGLCGIFVEGKNVETSEDGLALRGSFDALEERLNAQYGKNEKNDTVKNRRDIWNTPNDFMTALLNKEQRLEIHWIKEVGSTLGDNIQEVSIRAMARSSEEGFILLRYRFENYKECRKELKELDAAEDDVL